MRAAAAGCTTHPSRRAPSRAEGRARAAVAGGATMSDDAPHVLSFGGTCRRFLAASMYHVLHWRRPRRSRRARGAPRRAPADYSTDGCVWRVTQPLQCSCRSMRTRRAERESPHCPWGGVCVAQMHADIFSRFCTSWGDRTPAFIERERSLRHTPDQIRLCEAARERPTLWLLADWRHAGWSAYSWQ